MVMHLHLWIALWLFALSRTVFASEEGFLEVFPGNVSPDDWYIADYVNAARWLDTAWRPDLITVEPSTDRGPFGAVTLGLRPDSDGTTGKSFLGSELQSKGKFGYGDYEVIMQAGRGDGMVSSFFTYTGPHFGDPHDEIDFEFLGRDTTRVCLNRYVDGERMERTWVELGFDAAASANLYRFEWRPDRIAWFVNGVQVHEITSDSTEIPSHPSKVMMNVWVGGPGQKAWLRSPAPDLETAARYHCVSYRPEGSNALQCHDLAVESRQR